MAGGAALIYGASDAFTGQAITMIAGTSVKQMVAVGILSYDLFGVLVAPIVGVDIELIEWGSSSKNFIDRELNLSLVSYICF
ncbi:MAG: hypothetical protein IJW64_06250 [Clostridia bacterium]|nr:hypothetical protein [Clostridia bacterium]